MTIPFYQVTAFSRSVFGGNQACVMPMEGWLSDDLLLHIAQENAVAETAYLKRMDPGCLRLAVVHPRPGDGPLRTRHVGLCPCGVESS